MKTDIKMWCLHCEKTFLLAATSPVYFPNNYQCSNCGSGCMDISECVEEDGFFKQAYPNLEYKDIKINKHYPLYPKE